MYKSTLLNLLGASVASAQLHSLALDAGLKYFGTAADNSYTSDTDFMAILDDTTEFGQLVPENGQKWDATEATEGTFTYTSADVIPDLAAANGQILRCHTLTWYSQLPSWVSSGSWTKAQLTSVIQAHISNVVGHFKGDCYAWDVVNEAAADDGTWRSSVFYEVMGTDFLAVSFNAAAEADPSAKLYYNDYNLEYNGAKTDKAVEIVQIVQDAGAPIDGVGFQGHLIVGSTPSRSSLVTALERFTALGLEVAYTELDIRHSSVPASDSALATQGDDYANVVGSCLDVAGCVGVTVWGFSDKYSWVPDTFSGAGEACLYDDEFNKKPAWTSVSSLLAAAATGSSGSSSSTVVSSAVLTSAVQSSSSAVQTSVVESSAAPQTTVLATTAETTSVVEAAPTSEVSSSIEVVSTVEAVPTTETTPAVDYTPSSSVVLSSAEEVSTPVYSTPVYSTPVYSTPGYSTPEYTLNPILTVPTTFSTRVNTGLPSGGYNSSATQTTFQTRTTSVALGGDAPVSSAVETDSPVQSTAVDQPSIITTIVSPSNTRVPVIRHSTTAYTNPWTNGSVTTVVTSVPAGTAPAAVPTETGDDADCDDDDSDDNEADDEDDCDEDDDETDDEEDCDEEDTVYVAQYYQCGGVNWTGSTECEDPYVCVKMNDYYSQCVEA